MAEVTAGGIRFHVQRLAQSATGSEQRPAPAPIVVFVHGLVIDNMSSYYYTVANPAARAGADVILYDLRGHGATERPPTGYSVEAAIADLAGLLDAMEVTRPIHLVGNSFGGAIALAMTMAHPERVASLLLIDAVVIPEDWAVQLGRLVSALRSKGMQLRGHLLERRCERGRGNDRFYAVIDGLLKDTTLAADLLAAPPFSSAGLRSIACPVVAAYGADSEIIHHAATLKRLLPDLDLTVVPNCSHFLLGEAPSVVRELLLHWLASDAVTERAVVEKAPVR